ncbi:hypothetical protein MASSI9I_70407 [Massilia sp. 9I]|nr:hypothetical protein MASSI9I_70407 [Massilia sp. 9I]
MCDSSHFGAYQSEKISKKTCMNSKRPPI